MTLQFTLNVQLILSFKVLDKNSRSVCFMMMSCQNYENNFHDYPA